MNDRDTDNVFRAERRRTSSFRWSLGLWMSFVLASTWLTLAAAQAML